MEIAHDAIDWVADHAGWLWFAAKAAFVVLVFCVSQAAYSEAQEVKRLHKKLGKLVARNDAKIDDLDLRLAKLESWWNDGKDKQKP